MMVYSLASRVYLPECQVLSTCQVYPYTGTQNAATLMQAAPVVTRIPARLILILK